MKKSVITLALVGLVAPSAFAQDTPKQVRSRSAPATTPAR